MTSSTTTTTTTELPSFFDDYSQQKYKELEEKSGNPDVPAWFKRNGNPKSDYYYYDYVYEDGPDTIDLTDAKSPSRRNEFVAAEDPDMKSQWTYKKQPNRYNLREDFFFKKMF